MNYCMHCGAAFVAGEEGGAEADTRICGQCGKTTERPRSRDPEETVGLCRYCTGEVTALGTYCPWCGKEIRSAFEAAVNAGVLKPAPFQAQWPFSPWHGEGKGRSAPLCPKCGQKVRSDDAERPGHIGYSNPPWNAGWNGTCENCHFRFEYESEQSLHFHVGRKVSIRPNNRFYRTFVDEGFVLSGIEITVTDNEYGKPAEEKTLFLSMGELASLMQALQQNLSVYWEQFDWGEDWT